MGWRSEAVVPAMEPLGRALLEHLASGSPVELTVTRDDGLVYPLSTRDFFQVPDELSEMAALARSLARGRVLDVGAAAGRAALEFEQDGLDVWALDACPQCVEVMARRGVARPVEGDVRAFDQGPFDTICLLMDTLGLAGSLDALPSLLAHLRSLLAPRGRIVLDASALDGGATGTVQLQLRRGDRVGAVVPWLYLGEDALLTAARAAGLRARIALRIDALDHFLAVLCEEDDEPARAAES